MGSAMLAPHLPPGHSVGAGQAGPQGGHPAAAQRFCGRHGAAGEPVLAFLFPSPCLASPCLAWLGLLWCGVLCVTKHGWHVAAQLEAACAAPLGQILLKLFTWFSCSFLLPPSVARLPRAAAPRHHAPRVGAALVLRQPQVRCFFRKSLQFKSWQPGCNANEWRFALGWLPCRSCTSLAQPQCLASSRKRPGILNIWARLCCSPVAALLQVHPASRPAAHHHCRSGAAVHGQRHAPAADHHRRHHAAGGL